LGCVLLVVLAVLAVTVPAVADGGYAPPVGGPVVDHFRLPLTRFGAGNRGIDYATVPGQPVRAAAPGEVVFAGRVGLTRHVVVLHADGLRTSYSFLEEVDVRRGDHVDAGTTVGRAGPSLHFGVRDGQDRYLDPEVLLRGDPLDVHLVPLRSQAPASEAAERRSLVASLVGLAGGGVHAAATGVAWARDAAVDVAVASLDQLQALLVSTLVDTYGLPVLTAVELVRGIELFREGQRDCTPGGSPPGPPTGGRHLAVLVAGFGSSSGQSAVLDIDTAALG
jgi:hypothetical protein